MLFMRTGVSPKDGSYFVELQANQETPVRLTRPKALEWAADCARAAQEAAYDAALIQQLRALKLEEEAIMRTVFELRRQRKPYKTPPFELRPSVSLFTAKPFIEVLHNGRGLATWEYSYALHMATEILELLAAAQLDAQYRKFMIKTMGIEPGAADAAISDLANYRVEEQPEQE